MYIYNIIYRLIINYICIFCILYPIGQPLPVSSSSRMSIEQNGGASPGGPGAPPGNYYYS